MEFKNNFNFITEIKNNLFYQHNLYRNSSLDKKLWIVKKKLSIKMALLTFQNKTH